MPGLKGAGSGFGDTGGSVAIGGSAAIGGVAAIGGSAAVFASLPPRPTPTGRGPVAQLVRAHA